MSSVDPRVRELFIHLRRTVDIIEELMLRRAVTPAQQNQPEARQAQPSPSQPSIPHKFAYSIKEVRELIAISNSSIYKEIGEGRLSAVKRGNRTMILAADLQDWVSRWRASRSSGGRCDRMPLRSTAK
jgi:excisionase family DNA binding protein